MSLDRGLEMFLDIEANGLAVLQGWVAERKLENLNLEFKEKAKPTLPMPTKEDLKQFSRTLSGFSNSDGGLLVWGIEARKEKLGDGYFIDAAVNLKPIHGVRAFESKLQSVVGDLIRPLNHGVRMHSVLQDSDTGYLVVYIPCCDRRPVRAESSELKQYFKRSGGSTYAMEHFDIEDMFATRIGPKLIPSCRITEWGSNKGSHEGSVGTLDLACEISLKNVGRGIARYPFLNIESFSNMRLSKVARSGSGAFEMVNVPLATQCEKFAGGTDAVLHPGLSVPIAFFMLRVNYGHADGKRVICGGPESFACTFMFGADGHLAERCKISLTLDQIKECHDSDFKADIEISGFVLTL